MSSQLDRNAAKRASQAALEAAGLRTAEPNLIEARGFSPLHMLSSLSGLIQVAVALPFLAKGVNWLAGRKALSSVAAPLQKVGKIGQSLDTPLGEVADHVSALAGKSKLVGTIQEATTHLPRLSALSKVSEFAKATLSGSRAGALKARLMETPTSQVLLGGGMAIGQTAQTAITFGNNMRALQQMQRDLTGETPSTLGLMLGTSKLHPLVRQARSEATGLRAKAAMAVDVAGAALNVGFMLFDRSGGVKGGIKQMAAFMLPNAISGILTSGDTALSSYSNMTIRMAHTGKAELGDYVGLIGGLAKGASAQAIQKVAEQAYAKQLKPPEVLKMMAEANVSRLAAAIAANAPDATAKPPVTVGRNTYTPKASTEGHVAALASRANEAAQVARA